MKKTRRRKRIPAMRNRRRVASCMEGSEDREKELA